MRAFFKKKVVIVVLAVGFVAVVILRSGFSVMEMSSSTMEPVITGRGSPPSHRGDRVVVGKWFRAASLRNGDLVVVDIPTPYGLVRTVLRIEQQPDTPIGQYYVRAERDNGIDSRHFGALPASAIYGKVIWILRRN